ncbi:MAG: ACP S-malonyltransferase [Firmicutes bacterium]|jgi:[acyl-carrier-protein] S-malonyltransferase|nr:ACP S-malonyltransferase [Bacillota bacterium]NLL88130.1 ACP S-malonyltransferase [Bacillota bacterium]HKM17131.1 ACP S-malonyltransferase [Limnochordia bacterium]
MIAAAFPGQGVQHIGMAGELNATRCEYFDRASEILGYNLLELCQSGPIEQLSNTRFAQVAIMVTCISHWAILSKTVTPQVLLGHSLGEVTALIASGAIGFDDGVRITAKRGELMAACAKVGKMVAVLGLDCTVVESIAAQAAACGSITIANYNSPEQCVLSGEVEAIDYACDLSVQRGARRVVRLKVSGPFHSPLMQEAAEGFEAYLKDFSFSDPKVPVISNINSGLITGSEQVKMELVGQITSSVQWINNIHAIERLGVAKLVEIGPGKVLTGLTRRIAKTMEVISYP